MSSATGRGLVRANGQIVNPRTGELLELELAAPEELADARDAVVAAKHELDELAALLDAELTTRIDRAVRSGELRSYTVIIPGFEVSIPSPTAGGKLDTGALRAHALELAERLRLAPLAIEQAFEAKTTYALRRAVWNGLAKQEPYLSVLEREHTGEPGRRRATVTALTPRPPAIDTTAEEDFPA